MKLTLLVGVQQGGLGQGPAGVGAAPGWRHPPGIPPEVAGPLLLEDWLGRDGSPQDMALRCQGTCGGCLQCFLHPAAPEPAVFLLLLPCTGTRVYVKLDPVFQGRVAGLCGNFDGDTENDFTSQQGMVEPTADLFGNSWRVSLLCPEVNEGDFEHPCTVRVLAGGQGEVGKAWLGGRAGGLHPAWKLLCSEKRHSREDRRVYNIK